MKRAPLQDALAVTKALADGQRVRIVMLLLDGELCVCQLVAVLHLAASTVSKHLSILGAAGLVEGRRDGRWAYYSLAGDVPPVRWLRGALRDDPAVGADAAVLRKIKRRSLEVLCRQQRPN